MDIENKQNVMQEEAVPALLPIGKEQLLKFTEVLQRYKAGKSRLEKRIVSSEQWWKLRNQNEEEKHSGVVRGGWHSQSGWLHNVISSKHADAMDSYPSAKALPREAADQREAQILSQILPVILEHNHFESTYSDVMWQKLKFGTGCYKITWDKSQLGGLGDISIERANLLNVFWEPGVTDIQRSKYFFDTELVDDDILEMQYPQLHGKLGGAKFMATRFLYDDTVSTDGKSSVIGVYYHKNGLLHYCKYTGETVLESTENDPQLASTGLYDHGLYPFVFDALFPVEGSPCGYGYVDICRNPQTEIDLLKTACVTNAMAGATPRYFVRQDGSVNEEELLDLTKPVVHTNGNLGEDSLRVVDHADLPGNYINMLTATIQELRETSGNTETATGSTSSGVTAASAIAALQEASGKTSRDSTKAAYRNFLKIVEICVELIRQFYDVPRQFRIVGQMGMEQFVSYSNQNIKPQDQGNAFGIDLGMRKPVFDIKVEAQKRSSYSTLAQNELAMQFFAAGFFNPQMADQALATLQMMEFEGRDEVMQRIAQNGQLFDMLMQVEAFAVQLAAKYNDATALNMLQNITAKTAGSAAAPAQIPAAKMPSAEGEEHANVRKAREQSANASQPDGENAGGQR